MSTCSGEFLTADDSAAPRRLRGQLIVDWASLTLTNWLAKAEHHREGNGPDDLIRGESNHSRVLNVLSPSSPSLA